MQADTTKSNLVKEREMKDKDSRLQAQADQISSLQAKVSELQQLLNDEKKAREVSMCLYAMTTYI
jgi:hypothetical protein